MRSTHVCSRWTRLVGVLCRPFEMQSHATIARALSNAFVAGEIDVDRLVESGSRVLGRRWRWLRPLARRVVERFGGRPRHRQTTVAKFILSDRGFSRACERHKLRIADVLAVTSMMCPIGIAHAWRLPPILNAGELADWLGVTTDELDWFADLRTLEFERNQGRLRHYHYRPLMKRFGQVRLIEAPKSRLKEIQRRILRAILGQIPSHDAAHGFCAGRSIMTFATPHVGKKVVLKIDLQDFFPSISAARIQSVFRAVGYPEGVADLLAGLCTNVTPEDVWQGGQAESRLLLQEARWRYSRLHLPQGAPTSPALANLCAYRMDCRLSGLARSAGAIYTRYADDLAFSGDDQFLRVARRFHVHVCATVMEEGFSVHHRKTRMMQQGVRQRVAGIVVNNRLNVPREDFDRLKATLTNCIRLGPQSQNRGGLDDFRHHLNGRVSFVESLNPAKGQRLRSLYDRIEW
jgi:RNA-directed DNA polymerase